jgi:hypothetical protein
MSGNDTEPFWRNDIDSLAFRPRAHVGLCVMHRRAFRTLMAAQPDGRACLVFHRDHSRAFAAAAAAKILRCRLAPDANFHLTSRDVRRHLQGRMEAQAHP